MDVVEGVEELECWSANVIPLTLRETWPGMKEDKMNVSVSTSSPCLPLRSAAAPVQCHFNNVYG